MNGGVELSFACGAVRALTPGAALVLGLDSVKNDWEAGDFVSRRQAKVEQLEDGTVRIESLGQNATGVFTNKWEGGWRKVACLKSITTANYLCMPSGRRAPGCTSKA